MVDTRQCEKPSARGSFKGVRPSKFRHMVGVPAKADQSYQTSDLNPTGLAFFCPNSIDVNPKFLALVVEGGGGGAFVVLPLECVGRVVASHPRVGGHRGPVTCLKWCPHDDNLLASASEDAAVRLWHVPDGGFREDVSEPQCVLEGHSRKVALLCWHPTADGVLFSAGADKMVCVWDVNTCTCLVTMHGLHVTSMSLNHVGSLLAVTCADNFLRVVDARTGAVLQEGKCHEGTKASQAVYLWDLGRIVTVGFSRDCERQLAVWDERDLSQPLVRDVVDTSSGALVPFYDPDTRLLYVAGKGDGNIRFYEVSADGGRAHYVGQFMSGAPQRGLAMMPKRGCALGACEVARFYKLWANKAVCQPVSVVVPRKAGNLHRDLYPDTPAPAPALGPRPWLAGLNLPPVMMPLVPDASLTTQRPRPLRPADAVADKNADKKFLFLTNHTRADYRPIANQSGPNSDQTEPVSDENRSVPDENRDVGAPNRPADPPRPAADPSRRVGGTSEKDLKTSSNMDTKFQDLRRKWTQSQCSDGEKKQEQSCPPKPQHTPLYQEQQQRLNNSNNNNRKNSNVLAVMRRLQGEDRPSRHAYDGLPSTEKIMDAVRGEDLPSCQFGVDLRRAYVAQCEELKILRRQIIEKDRKIRELQLLLEQSGVPSRG